MLNDADTTVDAGAETAGDTSQAETTTEQTAEAQETQVQTDSEGTGADDNLAWLQKKANIDPNDPDALHKAAEIWRKADQDFHQDRQAAKSQLHEEATTAIRDAEVDPVTSRMQVLETRIAVSDFYSSHEGARAFDAEMAEIVKAKPYLAGDLETVYTLAKAGKSEADIKAAETRGRTQAKQEIAKASTAGAPRGNATTSAAQTDDEARLARFSDWGDKKK